MKNKGEKGQKVSTNNLQHETTLEALSVNDELSGCTGTTKGHVNIYYGLIPN